jgi:hypothetical protein
VLLGLARGRADWFRDVGQWATSAAIAAEFVKCVSVEEVRARLASGRPHSALLVDVAASGFDRDLVGAADAARTPVIAVSDGRDHRWSPDLGVVAVLPAGFDREQLLEVLGAHGRPVGRADTLPPLLDEQPLPQWRGRLIAVCGSGGAGTSTIAIALAPSATAGGWCSPTWRCGPTRRYSTRRPIWVQASRSWSTPTAATDRRPRRFVP